MPSLLDLPTELLIDITYRLQPQGDPVPDQPWPNVRCSAASHEDLLSLCIVCSILRDVAQPILFGTMRIDTEQETFESVTKTLHHSPLLATKVRHIVIGNTNPRLNIHDISETTARESLEPSLAILTLLTHVTSLHIHSSGLGRANRDMFPDVYTSVESPGSNTIALLPHLRSLFIRPANPTTDLVCIADFVRLMKCPGLDQISIYAGVLAQRLPAWSLDDSEEFVPGSLRVTRLNLLGCCVDKKSFQMLLSACPGLKSLRYSQLYNDNRDIVQSLGLDLSLTGLHPGPFLKSTPTHRTFPQMLETCWDTLEDLQLSIQTVIRRQPLPSGKMMGLRHLGRLRSLSIQGHHLDLFNDLPPSLEHLIIQVNNVHSLPSDRERFFSSSHNLQQIRCPQLKSVVFDDPMLESDDLGSHLFFQDGVAPGEWEHNGGKGLPCCYSWRANDVTITLREPQNHGRKRLRWPIMLDKSDMPE